MGESAVDGGFEWKIINAVLNRKTGGLGATLDEFSGDNWMWWEYCMENTNHKDIIGKSLTIINHHLPPLITIINHY